MMQPKDDDESVAATKLWVWTGECKLDLIKSGAQLCPTGSRSRCFLPQERKYCLFVGEDAYGPWAIGENRKFLWRTHFWWMCDYKTISEVLEYEGPISMLWWWVQELLGHHFSCIHCSARMMDDADGLTRCFDPIIDRHFCVAVLLHQVDTDRFPVIYVDNTEDISKIIKITPCTNGKFIIIPILPNKTINTRSTTLPMPATNPLINLDPNMYPSPAINIFSILILLCNAPPSSDHTQSLEGDGNMSRK